MAKKWKAYPWPDRQDDDDTTSGLHQDAESGELIIGEHITDTVHEQRRRLVHDTEDEEIDVVGDSTTTTTITITNGGGSSGSGSNSGSGSSNNVESGGNRASQQTCWGPHSPTAGATAPSPPPLNASGALYYHGMPEIQRRNNFSIPISLTLSYTTTTKPPPPQPAPSGQPQPPPPFLP